MLYSAGAANRVSWVLRREVCSWLYLATCTPNRNEGNTSSGQMDIIPRRHNRWQTSRTSTQASRSRQQGALCQSCAGLNTGCNDRCSSLGLDSYTTPSPTSSKVTNPSSSPTYKNGWKGRCQVGFLFILEDVFFSLLNFSD